MGWFPSNFLLNTSNFWPSDWLNRDHIRRLYVRRNQIQLSGMVGEVRKSLQYKSSPHTFTFNGINNKVSYSDSKCIEIRQGTTITINTGGYDSFRDNYHDIKQIYLVTGVMKLTTHVLLSILLISI